MNQPATVAAGQGILPPYYAHPAIVALTEPPIRLDFAVPAPDSGQHYQEPEQRAARFAAAVNPAADSPVPAFVLYPAYNLPFPSVLSIPGACPYSATLHILSIPGTNSQAYLTRYLRNVQLICSYILYITSQ